MKRIVPCAAAMMIAGASLAFSQTPSPTIVPEGAKGLIYCLDARKPDAPITGKVVIFIHSYPFVSKLQASNNFALVSCDSGKEMIKINLNLLHPYFENPEENGKETPSIHLDDFIDLNAT